MKNKFKKSKIIVPALALITATTVASVTGTVAWFTASRAATVTATSFKTTSLNENLKVKVEAIDASHPAGATTTQTTASSSGTVTVDGMLTHGSYDAKALSSNATEGNLYTPLMDSYAVTGYKSNGIVENHYHEATQATDGQAAKDAYDDWKAGVVSNKDVWYAVAWKMTFSVESDGAGLTSTVHFDPLQTTFTDGTTNGTTINGLRVALMSNNGYFVAAGDSTKTHVLAAGDRFTFTETTKTSTTKWAADTYFPAFGVNKAYTQAEFNALAENATMYTRTVKTTSEGSFADANFVNVVSKPSFNYPSDGDGNLKTANNYYLGDITSTSTLTVIAVAWFEGTDASIVTSTSTVMSDVTANLAFFSRTAA